MGCEVFNPWVCILYGYDFALQVWALCSHLGHIHILVSHQNDEILKCGLAVARKTPWTQIVFLSKLVYTYMTKMLSLSRSLRTSDKQKQKTEKFRWKRSWVKQWTQQTIEIANWCFKKKIKILIVGHLKTEYFPPKGHVYLQSGL